jgi:hypothetical protein
LKTTLAKYTRTEVKGAKKPVEEVFIIADAIEENVSG